eukprot:scaffold16317_cov135-Isochrysis_galbana.AAC.2
MKLNGELRARARARAARHARARARARSENKNIDRLDFGWLEMMVGRDRHGDVETAVARRCGGDGQQLCRIEGCTRSE